MVEWMILDGKELPKKGKFFPAADHTTGNQRGPQMPVDHYIGASRCRRAMSAEQQRFSLT
jgi:hypothetical protein